MIEKSSYPCPVCKEFFNRLRDRGGCVLWCGNGRCESIAANVGVVGDTEHLAYRELTKRIEANPEKKSYDRR